MLTLNEFLVKYNGQSKVGTTVENTGECVGIVQKWIANIYPTAPYIWGHAYSLLVNADPNFYDIIKNTPDAIPEPGDCIVWSKGFNGTYGHTAIVVKGNLKTFEVFEQNNPLGSPCRLHTYPDYAYVDGWFKPYTNISTPDVTVIPQYLTTLLQENKLSLDNEGQIREFFQKAINYKGLVSNLAAAQSNEQQQITVINALKQELENLKKNPSVVTYSLPGSSQDAPKTPDIVFQYSLANYHLVITKT